MIYQISKIILEQLNNSQEYTALDQDIPGIIHKIRETDSEIADLLLELKSKYEIHHFVSHDTELRSKMKDLWQIQSERTRQDQEIVLIKLQNILKTKNIILPSEFYKSS
jgi:hypothetical protein